MTAPPTEWGPCRACGAGTGEPCRNMSRTDRPPLLNLAVHSKRPVLALQPDTTCPYHCGGRVYANRRTWGCENGHGA